MSADIVAVPVPYDVLARSLVGHPKVRVQTLAEPMIRSQPNCSRTDELYIAVVDTETTGLEWRNDRIIELCVQCVGVDSAGHIVHVEKSHSWLEDPKIPISPEIAQKTGITDEMVAGRLILDAEAASRLLTADAVLAHNAYFDRPFVERRLGLKGLPWICSLRDLDWPANGFPGSQKLEDLLRHAGKFFEQAHRAASDVNALLHLLDHRLDSGRTVLKELLVNAAKPNWLVEVRRPSSDCGSLLASRRYSWDRRGRLWWRHVSDDRVQEETAFLEDWVYGGKGSPAVRQVTWRERYAPHAAHS